MKNTRPFCKRHEIIMIDHLRTEKGMATIKDIAKAAGVSVSTVSHVVNGTRFVSPELVEKVEKAISEADQLPNFIVKRQMAESGTDAAATAWKISQRIEKPLTGKKQSFSRPFILILMSERCSLFQDQVREALEQLLQDGPYSAITVCYEADTDKLRLIGELFISSASLAGIIAFPNHRGILNSSFFDGIRVPVVLIGGVVEGVDTDILLPDTFEGAYSAVRHLLRIGHQRIAFLTEAQDLQTRRYEGYRKALNEQGITPDEAIIIKGLTDEKRVEEAMEKLLEADDRPTAVVTADSRPLAPTLHYLTSRHIQIPKDISIVSLNDFVWAPLLQPSLTSVDKMPEKFASRALSVIKKRIENNETINDPRIENFYIQETLPSRLNIRASTCGIGRGPFGEKAEGPEMLALIEMEKDLIRKKECTAAISFHYTGKAWMRLMEKGIRSVFDELGITLSAVMDAHFDPEMQARQLDSVSYMKTDILIAMPVNTKETADAFRKAIESGTKLILISNVPEGFSRNDYASCVSVNEHSHGRNMGYGLGEFMMRNGLRNAALVRFDNEDFYATKQRDVAAEQILQEEYPEIKICGKIDFHRMEEAGMKIREFLFVHPEVEAFYISWEDPAVYVMEVLAEADRSDIAVVTGDLDIQVAISMASGGMVKTLSAQCPFEQGRALALAGANAVLGKEIPSYIGVEPILVTKDNLLKVWKETFREDPPAELRDALRKQQGIVTLKG